MQFHLVIFVICVDALLYDWNSYASEPYHINHSWVYENEMV